MSEIEVLAGAMEHAVITVPAAPVDLVRARQALRLAEPRLRRRDAGERLGVSAVGLRGSRLAVLLAGPARAREGA